MRAGKKAKVSHIASGKQREAGLSSWTRHTRTGRGQARKLFGMENARSCGSRDRDLRRFRFHRPDCKPLLKHGHGNAVTATLFHRTM